MEIVPPDEDQNNAFDAMPYFDPLQPDAEKLANEMIESEIASMGGKDRLMEEYLKKIEVEHGAALSSNITAPVKSQAIDVTRYDLGKASEEKGATLKAVEFASIRLEYERMREVNTFLKLRYDSSATLVRSEMVEKLAKSLEEAAAQLNEEVLQINRERQEKQLRAGKEIDDLQEQWGKTAFKLAHLRGSLQTLQQRGDDDGENNL